MECIILFFFISLLGDGFYFLGKFVWFGKFCGNDSDFELEFGGISFIVLGLVMNGFFSKVNEDLVLKEVMS